MRNMYNLFEVLDKWKVKEHTVAIQPSNDNRKPLILLQWCITDLLILNSKIRMWGQTKSYGFYHL